MMNRQLAYNQTYRTLFQTEPPAAVTWETSQAEILSPGRGFMQAFDFTMQIQVGCPGGCLFCYVSAGGRLTPAAVRGPQGRHWGFVVRDKDQVVQKLTTHLYSGRLADKTVYWSPITDPYAAGPATTRAIWQTLLATPPVLRPRRIVVQTRFRPDRDAALLHQYQNTTQPLDGGPPLVVSYSLGTDRNDLIESWEKATPLFEQRLQAIQTLRQSGIFVVATLSPLGLWIDLKGTLEQLKAYGVAYLTCLVLKEKTPSANTPSRFVAYLREQYPILLNPEWQAEQISQMQTVYGPSRVLVGKDGFDSLVHPHRVGQSSCTES